MIRKLIWGLRRIYMKILACEFCLSPFLTALLVTPLPICVSLSLDFPFDLLCLFLHSVSCLFCMCGFIWTDVKCRGKIGLSAFRIIMRDPFMSGIPLILETPAPEKPLEFSDLAIWAREIKLLYEIQEVGDDEWVEKEVEITKRWREERDRLNPLKPPKEKKGKEKKGKEKKVKEKKEKDEGKTGKKGKKGKKEEGEEEGEDEAVEAEEEDESEGEEG